MAFSIGFYAYAIIGHTRADQLLPQLLMEQFDNFPMQWFYAYAIIGHTRADQLLPQLLMEQFDTFPMQSKHIEHMHEGVWFRKNNF